MAVRTANAVWEGGLRGGEGVMKFGSGAFEGQYSYSSRFEEGPGTNPEELIGAAHAGCFSMAFSADLEAAGYSPQRVETTAKVTLGKVEGKSRITDILLTTKARVPDISEEKFQEVAEGAKESCPVSSALKGVNISLDAELVK